MLSYTSARRAIAVLIATASCLAVSRRSMATPSTNVWNPNTDIQAKGTWHLGIDNYFSLMANRTRPYAFPTDTGLTLGLGSGVEVGVDLMEPARNPVLFNAKWGVAEKDGRPAFAAGIMSVGVTSETQGNIAYCLVAKTYGKFGRITAGGYAGKKSFLSGDRGGAILAWDKQLSPKWWASVDYASGSNYYGAVSAGVGRQIAPNVSLIAGYVFFNNHTLNPNDVATMQLDINF